MFGCTSGPRTVGKPSDSGDCGPPVRPGRRLLRRRLQRQPRCRGRRRLLLLGEEEAAAAAGGGGCCCWGRMSRATAAVGLASLECHRLLATDCRRCGSRPDGEWPSRCRPRSESVSPEAGCAARLDRRYVYTYSQCTDPGLGPGEAVPPRQSFSVPQPQLSYAHCAEPAGVSGQAVCVSPYSCHYPSGAMLSSPSPPGVSGRAVCVSLSVRVSAGPGFGSGQPGHVRQWPGPVLAGAAVAASQCRGGASESATTGHEWPHADGAPVGTVLEPFMRSAHTY